MWVCAGLSLLCAAWPARSVAADRQHLLEELDILSAQREARQMDSMRSVLQRIRDAARTPQAAASAYMEAHRDVELVGLSGQTTVFSDWRRNNERWLSSTEFRLAAQFQLKYLALTLQRGIAERPADMVVPSVEYLKEFVEAEQRIQAGEMSGRREIRDLLRAPVHNGLFARAWRLSSLLERFGNWEDAAGNVEGILEKNIRSVYREQRSPLLLETWDWQIEYETSRLDDVRRQHAVDQFERVRKPSLQFGRARDQALLGEPLQAAAVGLQILKAHPEHPQFNAWADQIRRWLEAR